MNVGFIGLGNMGEPMAARIAAAGASLVVYDVREEVAAQLLENGATWGESPRAVARQCEFICTSLPGPFEAEQAYEGENGIVAGVEAGAICIDFTTNSAFVVRRLHDALAAKGARLLDAPVSGGVEGAQNGQLTVLVSGDEAAYARAKSVIDAVSNASFYLGDIGAASICKALHNCAVFCTNLAMMECLTVGVKSGLEAGKLIEVFQTSGLGRNLDLQVALPATLFQGNFQPRFAMKTAHKDMTLAMELARAAEAPTPVIDLCAADMTSAIEHGWGDEDNTIFLTLQEQRAGVEVRVNRTPDDH